MNKIIALPEANYIDEQLTMALSAISEFNAADVRNEDWRACLLRIKNSIVFKIQVGLASRKLEADKLQTLCRIYAILDMFCSKVYDMHNGFEHRLDALLCVVSGDNSEILTKACKYSMTCKNSFEPDRKKHLTTAVYALISGNKDFYSECKSVLLERKATASFATIDCEVMDSIWNEDMERLNQVLSVLCIKYKRARNADPVLREYLSIPGTVYAKIARMRGMIVSSSIPYIPHHLLECNGGDEKCELFEFMKRPPFVDYVNL